jgi:hypothetical protein
VAEVVRNNYSLKVERTDFDAALGDDAVGLFMTIIWSTGWQGVSKLDERWVRVRVRVE